MVGPLAVIVGVEGVVQGLLTIIGTSIEEPLPKEVQGSNELFWLLEYLVLTRISVLPIIALAGTKTDICVALLLIVERAT